MHNVSKKLLDIFAKYPSYELMGNVKTKIEDYKIKNTHIITTVNDKIEQNCYVVSPYNGLIAYSKDELIKINSKPLRFICLVLIGAFEGILKSINIDKAQSLNNYMLSTNFFKKDFDDLDIKKLRQKAIIRYPKHSLLIRSINKMQNPKLYSKLLVDGWLPMVSRQVYIYHKSSKKHRDYKTDIKLLKDENYEFIKADSKEDFEIAEDLYNQLYLDKYSIHNIHFKAIYLQELALSGLLHLRLLKDVKHNRIVGVVGIMGEDEVMTVPIVGYEMSYDKKEALYRRLIIYAINYANTHKYFLNLSSGAPHFKTQRGAKPCLEYQFVYVGHLGFYKKLVWKALSLISIYFYAKILKGLKL